MTLRLDSGGTGARRARARAAALWVAALVLTLASASWQRISGPTYPVRGTVLLGDTPVALKLTRSHGGPGDQPVRIDAPDRSIEGDIAWRRYPTSEAYASVPLRREGERLVGGLPHQPPAGKLEYQVRLRRGAEAVVFPPRPAVTRFKGDVPAAVLVPHVLAMFAGMIFSSRAGLVALADGDARRDAWMTLVLFALGGFVLGPIVQKFAFGAFWTGVPFGYDLTDNKTLVAGVAWAVALWRLRVGPGARAAVLVASLLTLAVFAIPHSTWGSEIRWETLPR